MNISIRSYKILYLKTIHFTSIRCACTLCLGSKRPMRLSALETFTNIGHNIKILIISMIGQNLKQDMLGGGGEIVIITILTCPLNIFPCTS